MKTIEQLARMQSRLDQTYEQVVEELNTEDKESEIDEYAEELARELNRDKHSIIAEARIMANKLTAQCRQSRLSSSRFRSYTNS